MTLQEKRERRRLREIETIHKILGSIQRKIEYIARAKEIHSKWQTEEEIEKAQYETRIANCETEKNYFLKQLEKLNK